MELGTNSFVIRPDGFTASTNWVFVVVEWVRSKRSIFVLLVELSIALVHVLEQGWTAVVEERLQSWKVTEISCDRQDRISVSVVLFKVAYKTNHRSEVWSICEIYVLQFKTLTTIASGVVS